MSKKYAKFEHVVQGTIGRLQKNLGGQNPKKNFSLPSDKV
jgi:hypothetical protein